MYNRLISFLAKNNILREVENSLGKRNQLTKHIRLLLELYKRPCIEVYMQQDYSSI
jgi:hypothetical protein